MTKLYLVRHGETEYNQSGCYYGWTDCSLALTGIQQAYYLKKLFHKLDFDVIYSSDLKRAVETASILNKDVEIIQDERLRELNFGAWEGKQHQEIMLQHQEHWNRWTEDWVHAAPTEGESFISMYNRVESFLQQMLEQHLGKDIVIVSHNGVLRCMAVYLLGLPMDKVWSFNFEQGRYSLLEINEGHCSIKAINTI